MIHYIYLILTVVAGIGMPLMAILSASKVKQLLARFPEMKLDMYQQVILTQWSFSLFLISLMIWDGQDLAQIGVTFDNLLWMLALATAPLLTLWIAKRRKLNKMRIKSLSKRYKPLLFLLPGTKSEYDWMIALSYTAGFCEEVIFRGFLFWQLQRFAPVLLAIILANFSFMLAHSATTVKNMFASLVLGVVWSISFLFLHHLWFGIVTHIMIDVYSVTIGYRLQVLGLSKEDDLS